MGSSPTGIWSSLRPNAPSCPIHTGPGDSLGQDCSEVWLQRESSSPTENGLHHPGLAQLSPAQLLLPSVNTPLAPPQFGAPRGLVSHRGPPWVIPISWCLRKGGEIPRVIPLHSLAKLPQTHRTSAELDTNVNTDSRHMGVSTSPMHANSGYPGF